MKDYQSTNPYNGEILENYTLDSSSAIHNKLQKALKIEATWSTLEIEDRCQLLTKVAELLIDRKEEYATLMTKEMGKPISQGIAEIEKCAWVCDFYALNAEDLLADEIIDTDADESFISHDPLGCVLAVMPWNYPFWQVLRFAAPTLTAGNTAILKHAKNVTGCSMAIEQLFLDAGYPEGCFQSIKAGHEEIEKLITDDDIKAVTLTGSEKAGRSIAATAGSNLKKSVLELGGNNACIVWEDADLDQYISTMATARMQNTGQSCIAAKRFIVCADIYDAFLEKFTNQVTSFKVGDPMKEDTFIGVMAREDLAEELQKQVQDSIDLGAKVILGNERNGAYYSPTILTNVTEDMPVFKEETFGPVAAIIKVENREEAIKVATNSRFGLGSMLFTQDVDIAMNMISDIPDGAFFINDMVKSDPRLPFGGTKASGYGRELSREGILEFVNKKTVYIKK